MSDPRMVTIAHALPTRVRLAAPRLAWHREACERIAHALAERGGLARVIVRPPTGSVIVEGADGPLAAEALRAELEALLREAHDDEGRPLAEPAQESRHGPTRIARAVAHAASGINADVRAALDGLADLGTVLPLVFAIGGIAQVGARRDMPSPTWFNLLWWSLRSFMTFNFEAVTEEEGQAGHPDGARRDAMGEI